MQRWSEVSSAASVAIPTRLRQAQGASLAELARSSSLAKLGTVREEAGELPRSASPGSQDRRGGSGRQPPAPATDSGPGSPEDEREDRDRGEWPLTEDRTRRLLSELQTCAKRVAQLQRQLEACEKSQAQLAGEICICGEHVDSVEKRVDSKLWEQSLAVRNMEQTVQDICSMEKAEFAKQDAKIQEVGQLLSGDPADSTLRAIDERLSAVCLRLEGAAPVLARADPSRIERIDEEGSPALEQWGRQVVLLRRELQEVVDEATARVADVERRCGCIESTLSQGMAVDIAEPFQRLEAEQLRRHEEFKEQLETLAKAGDDDVAGLSASVTTMSETLKRSMVEHQEGLDKHRELALRVDEVDSRVTGSLEEMHLRLKDPPLTDLVKMKEDILSELGAQYAQVRDQTIQMTAEHLTRQTDKVKKIIAMERHDREADVESALTAAIAMILKNLASGESGLVVAEDGKDAAVKAALGALGSVSTKAPTSADEDDEFPVVVRTVADRRAVAATALGPVAVRRGGGTPPVTAAAWVPAPAWPQAVELPRGAPPWSPAGGDFRPTLSPREPALDLGDVYLSTRALEAKREGRPCANVTLTPPGRNFRHTLSPNMINPQHRPGLPQSPPQSSRRTLSPTHIRRADAPEPTPKFAPQRRVLGVPSSPALLSRQ